MDPRELNIIITAITNQLYTNLSKKDFLFLNIVFSELSKSMFSMELLRGICQKEQQKEKKEQEK